MFVHLVEEVGADGELDGHVEVRVVEDDERGLAAELEVNRLQVALRGGLHYEAPNLCGSSESHLKHAGTNAIKLLYSDVVPQQQRDCSPAVRRLLSV